MASGWNSWVSFKEESTYGTDPGGARQGFARIVSDGASVNENNFQAPGMGTRAVRGLYPGSREVELPLEIESGYEGGWQYLIEYAMGQYIFTADTPVVGARTHQFRTADTLPTGLSIEISKGDIPANDVFLYTGCKVNTMELIIEQDSLMKANFGIIARNEAPDTVRIGAPTYPTLRPIKNIHYISMTVAGSAVAVVNRARIFIDNHLERFYDLGRYTAEPLSSEPQEVIVECDARFDNLTHYNKFLAGTEGNASISLSTVGEAVYVTGTTPYTMSFAASVCHLIGDTPKVEGNGVIYAPIRAQCIGSQPVAEIAFVNGSLTL